MRCALICATWKLKATTRLGCACLLLLCSACRARRSHRAPARAEDNTALAECAWCLQRLARRRGRRRCSDRKACCGFEGQLQLDAARGCAYLAISATACMTQCAAQFDLRGWRARGECHLAWRRDAKNGHDFVTIFGYQNELQHDAAHCCAYVQLHATTHVVWRAVQLDTRGQRARCEFHIA